MKFELGIPAFRQLEGLGNLAIEGFPSLAEKVAHFGFHFLGRIT
jgi:hypothetical protein